jgi:hypothetical protein
MCLQSLKAAASKLPRTTTCPLLQSYKGLIDSEDAPLPCMQLIYFESNWRRASRLQSSQCLFGGTGDNISKSDWSVLDQIIWLHFFVARSTVVRM